ncbi:hypothetical protein DLREEDagrD3_22690 [Denitratisoma sp. agr-D3]
MDLSIIIPTMNRPDLLLRLLGYYFAVGFDGCILVGDSSSEALFMQASRDMEKFRGRLHIHHVHLPGRSVAAAVMEMNAHVATHYVCLVADDDFIVPAGAEQCIAYLDGNPDYVAAHGVGILIASTSGRADEITGASAYPQTVREESGAAQRLLAHLAHYRVVLFSVHRVATWRRMFAQTPIPALAPGLGDKTFADELLPCCLSVAMGKVKEVDGLYLVRQVHDERYLLPNWFAWINTASWQGSYQYFRDQLADVLQAQDGVSAESARSSVDEAFRRYISAMAAADHQVPSQIRAYARQVRVMRWLWGSLQRMRERVTGGRVVSLQSLQWPRSLYHADFLPVYRAVTQRDAAR